MVVEARGDMVTKEGERYDNHYCLVYRLRNGKIIEMREYQDLTRCERVLGPLSRAADCSDLTAPSGPVIVVTGVGRPFGALTPF